MLCVPTKKYKDKIDGYIEGFKEKIIIDLFKLHDSHSYTIFLNALLTIGLTSCIGLELLAKKTGDDLLLGGANLL